MKIKIYKDKKGIYEYFKNPYLTHYLFEDLTCSYNIIELKNYLIKRFLDIISVSPIFDYKDSKKINPEFNSITISTKATIEYNELLSLIKTCENLYGWMFYNIELFNDEKYLLFPKLKLNYNEISKLKNKSLLNDITQIDIAFHGKFCNESLEFNDSLYHITDISKFNKIRKNGLVPKSSNKFSGIGQDRKTKIYFSPNIEIIDEFNEIIEDDKILVLRLSLKNLNTLIKNKMLHLFKDSKMIDGLSYFTYDNIHPKYLEWFDTKNNEWKNIYE